MKRPIAKLSEGESPTRADFLLQQLQLMLLLLNHYDNDDVDDWNYCDYYVSPTIATTCLLRLLRLLR